MTKTEYMEQLKEVLKKVDDKLAAEILEDYEAHFESAKEEGISEEEVIRELGSIEEFVAELSQYVDSNDRYSKAETDSNTNESEQNTERNADKNAKRFEDMCNSFEDILNRTGKVMGDMIDQLANQIESSGAGKKMEDAANHFAEQFEKNGTGKRVENVANRFASQMEKTFSRFGEFFSSFEKKSAKEQKGEMKEEANSSDDGFVNSDWEDCGEPSSDPMQDEFVWEMETNTEEAFPHCNERTGCLREADEVEKIKVCAEANDVHVHASSDGDFHYEIKGKEDSEDTLWEELLAERNGDTLSLQVVKRKNKGKSHGSILHAVFGESVFAEIHLWVPEWLSCLDITTKSGDISIADIDGETLHMHSMSGDIQIDRVRAGYCSVDVKSGDVCMNQSKVETVLMNLISGDVEADKLESEILDIKTVSGDISLSGAFAKTGTLATVSGDIDVPDFFSDDFNVKTISGDMSLRGGFGKLAADTMSGDIVVVQHGNTSASVNSASGDIDFHLKNEGEGFTANVTTNGDIDIRYRNLNLSECLKGNHRYGAEASKIKISSQSGDIRLCE